MTTYLGEFEHMVLLALARAGPANGARLHEELVLVTGRDVSIPAVYVTLSRMERKGLVRSRRADIEDARVRKVFQLTPAGVRALRSTREMLERLWRGVTPAAQTGRT
jgi:PadR family transcriptional regulator PadR